MVLELFGLSDRKILSMDTRTEGVVTKIKFCHWMKVNASRPIRIGNTFDATYPFVVFFTYTVDGTQYEGKRFFDWTKQPPSEGKRLSVYYDPKDPAKYAAKLY